MKALAWSAALAVLVGCGEVDRAERSPPRTDEAPTLASVIRRSELAFRQNGAGWRSAGDTFQVEVESNRFTLESLTGARLSLVMDVPAANGFSTRSTGDGSVEVDRGNSRERWRNEGHGVEQSWLVRTKPKNDFVVKIAVEGEFVKGTGSGLHFQGFRYGHGTWIDARAERTDVPARFEAGKIVLRVPNDVIERSTYPATLDPLITPEQEIDAPLTVSTLSAGSGHVACVSSTSCMAAYGFGGRILATRLDATQGVVGPAPIPIAKLAYGPILALTARGASEYLVVDSATGSANAWRVKPDGTVLDASPITIPSCTDALVAADSQRYLIACRVPNTDQVKGWFLQGSTVTAVASGQTLLTTTDEFSVGYGGGKFLVAAMPGIATRVDASTGAKLDATPIQFAKLAGVGERPGIAFGANTFFLGFESSYGMWGSRIRASDGVALDPDDTFNQLPGGVKLGPAYNTERTLCGFDGTYAVAFWEDSGGVVGARVNLATGLRVDGGNGSAAEFGVGGGVKFQPPFAQAPPYDVDFRNGAGALVWLTVSSFGTPTTIEGQFLSVGTNGVPVGGNTSTVSLKSNSQQNPAVASNGSSYMVVWEDTRLGDFPSQLYAIRLSLNGTPLDSIASQVNGTNYGINADIASDGTDYMIAWETLGKIGVRRFSGSTGAPLAPTYDLGVFPPHHRPGIASDGVNYLIAFQGTFGLYERRIESTTGNVLDLVDMDVGGTSTPTQISVAADKPTNPDFRSFLIVWTDSQGVNGRLVRSKSGAVINPQLLLGTGGTDARVTSDGTQFMVVWVSASGDVVGTRVDAATGASLDSGYPGGGKLLADHPAFLWAPAVAFDGASFVTTFRDSNFTSGGPMDIYGNRWTPAGQALDPTSGFLVANGLSAPRMASAGASRSLVLYTQDIGVPGDVAVRIVGRFIDNDGLPNDGGTGDAGVDAGSGGTAGSGGGAAGSSSGGTAGAGAGGSSGASTGGSGAGGAGVGGSGTGGSGAGGSGTGGSGAGGSGTGAGTSADGGGAVSGGETDEGCGCSLPRGSRTPWELVLLWTALVLHVMRRRRSA